ncbi:AraC family transcriptional regulator [Bombilactobacillus folatiphilus]|uniref:AraC family transcriptional regulator n=1 Tax=Bombilactobacillus folatiphilus TaxID=2923362 RepID=A0ABY4P9H8_9LACO|nr:AraC family transcriptional regulator [Bombilactobacillus folatiphilus]UQS82282.1 AraC family transcriptional regulator [Bombilactobacillus folatiphilus]
MNKQLLSLLRRNNQPRDWNEISASFAKKGNSVKKVGQITDEPTYEFFETYADGLVLDLNAITISVQPVLSYIPYHIHNYVEIMIPLVGECTVYLDKQELHLNCEDVLFIGNQTAHKVKPIQKNDIVVNIALKSSAFSLNDLNFLHRNGARSNISNLLFALLSNKDYGEGRYVWFQVQHQPKIVQTIYDIIDEYYHYDIQSHQIIRFNILTLFSRLIRQAYHSSTKMPSINNSQVNLLSLLLYIENNYRDIKLDDMAQHFGFNPNYLSTYLKKETGQTFIQLVHLQRVNTAAEYLIYTSAPIESIAAQVGYENPSYFYKIFKKVLGVSPDTYRQQFK